MNKLMIALCLCLSMVLSAQAAVLYLGISGVKGPETDGPFKEWVPFSGFKVTQAAATSFTGAASGGGGATIVAERSVDGLSASIHNTFQVDPLPREIRGAILLDDGKVIDLKMTGVNMKTYFINRENNKESLVIEELTLSSTGLTQSYK